MNVRKKFKLKLLNLMSSDRRTDSFSLSYIKTCDLSHKRGWRKNRTHLIVRQNIRSLKGAASRVGRGRRKKEVADIHHQHHPGLTCLSVTDVYGHTGCDGVQGVRSYQAAVKTGRPTMKFGRAGGNIWASRWSLWHDSPVSEACGQSTQQECKSLAASHLERPSLITSASFELFTTQRRRDSQIKAPADSVHHTRAHVWR